MSEPDVIKQAERILRDARSKEMHPAARYLAEMSEWRKNARTLWLWRGLGIFGAMLSVVGDGLYGSKGSASMWWLVPFYGSLLGGEIIGRVRAGRR